MPQPELEVYTVLEPPIVARLAANGADSLPQKCDCGAEILLDPNHQVTQDLLGYEMIALTGTARPLASDDQQSNADSDQGGSDDDTADLSEGVGQDGSEGDQTPAELTPINSATVEELKALQYVGKAIAQRIIAARPLSSWEHFQQITDLRDEQIAELQLVAVI
jgi:hypothetical protein